MSKLHAKGYAAPFTELEQGIKAYVANYLSQADRYV